MTTAVDERLIGSLLDTLESELLSEAVYSSGDAPAPRTLLDILRQTTRRHPTAAAIDDGTTVLTYRALDGEVEALRRRLAEAGVGAGDRVGVRVAVRHRRSLRRDPRGARGRRRVRAGRRRRPGRARRAGLHRGRRVRGSRRRSNADDARGAWRPAWHARAGRRRLDHLHLRVHRQAEGRRRQPPRRRRVRRRRVAHVPGRRADRPRGPGSRRPLGRVRRVLRGDVAGLAVRRVPGAGAAVARAHRHGSRPVAGRATRSRSSRPSRRWPRSGPPTRSTRYAC